MPFVEAADMVPLEPLPGWRGRAFHSDNMTFVYYEIAADATPLHEHRHQQEEVFHVVAGEIIVSVDGAEQRLGPGSAAVVPANARHSARPVTACRTIIADYPLRLELPGRSH